MMSSNVRNILDIRKGTRFDTDRKGIGLLAYIDNSDNVFTWDDIATGEFLCIFWYS